MLGLGALLLAACGDRAPAPGAAGLTTTLTIHGARLAVEVAADAAAREQGLMFRRTLPAAGGMLFVFPAEAPLSFWMRNTYVPLSVAFLDRRGVILNIEDMQPLSDTSHYARSPALYALEVNQGWFTAHRVGAGERVDLALPPDLVAR